MDRNTRAPLMPSPCDASRGQAMCLYHRPGEYRQTVESILGRIDIYTFQLCG
jgi:hypothetical protein